MWQKNSKEEKKNKKIVWKPIMPTYFYTGLISAHNLEPDYQGREN